MQTALLLSAKFLLLLVPLLLSFEAKSVERVYRIAPAPWDDADVCRQHAVAIGRNLSAINGFEILGATCEYIAFDRRNGIIIRYEDQDQGLALVSTGQSLVGGSAGRYANAAACMKQEQQMLRRFEKNTQLKAHMALCMHGSLHGEFPWYVRVDAFGDAKLSPNRIRVGAVRPYGSSMAQLNDELRDSLSVRGFVFDGAVWRLGPMGSITIHTYSPTDDIPLTLSESTVGSYRGLTECQEAKKRLVESFGLIGTDQLWLAMSYCGSAYGRPTIFELRGVWHRKLALRLSTSSDRFSDIASCEARASNIGQDLASGLGHDVLFAMCGISSRFELHDPLAYRVVVFSLPQL